jgi:hypothetical protein
MDPMPTASIHSLLSHPFLDSQGPKLPQGDDTVLPLRAPSKTPFPLPTGRFPVHFRGNRPVGGHAGEADGAGRTSGARIGESVGRL